MGDYTTLIVVGWLACVFLGWAIGSSKGQAAAGVVLTAILGILGLLIVLFMKPAEEPQPAEPTRPAKWWPDPYGRHAQRYYDGVEWTNHIIDASGNQGIETL